MDYFLFNGGPYKHNVDDGQIRKPLNCAEVQLLEHDPEVPGDTDNSVGGTFDLAKFPDVASKLKVDDALYVQIIPDATIIRGLWAMAGSAYNGFKFELELVDACKVYEAIKAGNLGTTVGAVASPLVYDAADGLGCSIIDAVSHAAVEDRENCDGWKDHRNTDALQFNVFPMTSWVKAGIGQAFYIRMIIKELPDPLPDNQCKECGLDTWPEIQLGAFTDKVCVEKNRIKRACVCTGIQLPDMTDPCCD